MFASLNTNCFTDFDISRLTFKALYDIPWVKKHLFGDKNMIQPVTLRDTKKEDWQKLRETMLSRIMETFGTSPVPLSPAKNDFYEVERYESYGLTHIKIRYNVFDDEWSNAIIVLLEFFCFFLLSLFIKEKVSHASAITSTSQRTFLGSVFTATQLLAGFDVKYLP